MSKGNDTKTEGTTDASSGHSKAPVSQQTGNKRVEETVHVTTVEDEIIESLGRPIKDLEDALNSERQKQEDTFRILIEENARLEVSKKKLEQELEDEETKNDVLKAEVETGKEKMKEKDDQIAEMKKEIIMLMQTKKKKKGSESEENLVKVLQKYDETGKNGTEVDEQSVRDLKTKLKRMARESEQKDQRIIELQKELRLTQEFAAELQRFVDEQRADEIKRKLADLNVTKKASYYDPANVVVAGRVQQSEVCIIQ